MIRLCAASVLAVLLAGATAARAQVSVLRIDLEADPVCRDVEAALAGTGVVADPGYLSQARQQGLDPSSDAALELIVPLLGVKLAVIPLYVDEQSVRVEYRDGRNGARLGTASVPHERGQIGARGRAQLKRDVLSHLDAVLSGAPPPRAEEPGEESGELAPQHDGEDGAEDAARSLHVRVHAGLGLGTRDVEWTADGRGERAALGAFPAFDLGLWLTLGLSDAVDLALDVDYQSSLAYFEVEEPRMAAPADRVGVRAHRFTAVIALPIRFGAQPSVSLAPALGLGIRNLRPEVHHLSTPAYSLAGPVAQLALGLPIADRVALRVMPEAQWLVVGEGLRDRSVDDTGISLGGELAVIVEVMGALSVELSYREAHALLSSLEGSAGDVERFATLRGVVTL